MTEPTSLPSDAIQRVLFIASSVHIYAIPPLTTTKGYHAASWTNSPHAREIFLARLRILETAIPHLDGSGESLSTEILLEDPATGQLFAAAPYQDAGAVEAALDSARFFAVRVVGDGGKKAVLGIGFEERAEAMDFGIALQEVRKVQGVVAVGGDAGGGRKGKKDEKEEVGRRDFSLKEGETIHVDIGRKGRRKDADSTATATATTAATGTATEGDKFLFAIKPPPPAHNGDVGAPGASASMPLLPPPPSAQDVRAEKRKSRQNIVPPVAGSAADLGFDDGEFGEFQ